MRREHSARTVHLSSRGDMREEEVLVQTQGQAEAVAGADFCRYDYTLGEENSKECEADSQHHLILQEEMCIQAAKQAHAGTETGRFKLDTVDKPNHPKGCFYMKNCAAGARTKDCFFFNGVEPEPNGATITGTPVCSRPKYKMGTKDSVGGAADGNCPVGYSVIMHQLTCAATATCLSKACPLKAQRVGEHNASRQMDYPIGCFVDPDDGCMYFNPTTPINGGTPSAPRGVPVCNVSTVATFANGVEVESTQESLL